MRVVLCSDGRGWRFLGSEPRNYTVSEGGRLVETKLGCCCAETEVKGRRGDTGVYRSDMSYR